MLSWALRTIYIAYLNVNRVIGVNDLPKMTGQCNNTCQETSQ